MRLRDDRLDIPKHPAKIAPASGKFDHRQQYLPDSNILITRFLAPEGVAEISDFMPVEESDGAHRVIRRVKTKIEVWSALADIER